MTTIYILTPTCAGTLTTYSGTFSFRVIYQISDDNIIGKDRLKHTKEGYHHATALTLISFSPSVACCRTTYVPSTQTDVIGLHLPHLGASPKIVPPASPLYVAGNPVMLNLLRQGRYHPLLSLFENLDKL
jgi:hypothetical protein